MVITQEYRINRAQFPQAELLKHQGTWVAFSADGRQIVARGATVEQVEQQIASIRENDNNVVLEWLSGSEEDNILEAGEWM